MMSLTWMYNDLHGADEHYAVRNLINAARFMTYNYGTSRVAAGGSLNPVMIYQWVPMVGAVVLTTLQMQDMSDQKGDAERGRGTMPLVWGDGVARWSIAVGVVGCVSRVLATGIDFVGICAADGRGWTAGGRGALAQGGGL